jgi:hypothetical protein
MPSGRAPTTGRLDGSDKAKFVWQRADNKPKGKGKRTPAQIERAKRKAQSRRERRHVKRANLTTESISDEMDRSTGASDASAEKIAEIVDQLRDQLKERPLLTAAEQAPPDPMTGKLARRLLRGTTWTLIDAPDDLVQYVESKGCIVRRKYSHYPLGQMYRRINGEQVCSCRNMVCDHCSTHLIIVNHLWELTPGEARQIMDYDCYFVDDIYDKFSLQHDVCGEHSKCVLQHFEGVPFHRPIDQLTGRTTVRVGDGRLLYTPVVGTWNDRSIFVIGERIDDNVELETDELPTDLVNELEALAFGRKPDAELRRRLCRSAAGYSWVRKKRLNFDKACDKIDQILDGPRCRFSLGRVLVTAGAVAVSAILMPAIGPHFVVGSAMMLLSALLVEDERKPATNKKLGGDYAVDCFDPTDNEHADVCQGPLDLSVVELRDKAKIYPKDVPCLPKRGSRKLGVTVADSPSPFVYAACPHNEARALALRQAKRTPEPNLDHVYEVERECTFRDALVRNILNTQLLDFDVYVSQTGWTGARKREIREARLNDPNDPRYRAQWSMMVKRENTRPEKYDSPPRCIMMMEPTFQAWIGPSAHMFNEALKATLHINERIFYASGRTPTEMGAWIGRVLQRLGNNVAFLLVDDSKLDTHHGPAHLQYITMKIRQHPSHEAKQAAGLLEDNREMEGRSANGVVFKGIDNLGSGSGITSPANTYTCAKYHDETMRVTEIEAYVILGGDDALVVCRADDAHVYARHLIESKAEGGFETEVEIKHRLCDAQFYSGLFYPLDDGTYLFGPLVGRQIAKMFYQHQPFPGKDQMCWTKAVANSMGQFARCVGPLQALCENVKRQLQLTQNKELREFRMWIPDNDQTVVWGDLSNQLLADRYGVDVDLVNEAIEEARHVKVMGYLHSPFWKMAIDRDYDMTVPEKHDRGVNRVWQGAENARIDNSMPQLSYFKGDVLMKQKMSAHGVGSWLHVLKYVCDVCATPILEEYIKMQHPVLPFIVALIETFRERASLGSQWPRRLLFRTVGHYSFTYSPVGTVAHVLHGLLTRIGQDAAAGSVLLLSASTIQPWYMGPFCALMALRFYQPLLFMMTEKKVEIKSLPQRPRRGNLRGRTRRGPEVQRGPVIASNFREKTASGPPQLPNRKPRRGPIPRKALQPSVDVVEEFNAAKSLHAMSKPTTQEAQLWPDSSMPSTAFKLVYDADIVPVQDATSMDYIYGIFLYPKLKANYAYVSASTAGALTTTNVDHPKLSTIETQFSLYRCTALELEVLDLATWDTKEGRIYTGMSQMSTPASIDDISSARGTVLEAMSSMAMVAGRKRIPWQPVTLMGGLTNSSGTMGVSGLGWKDPSENEVFDSLVFALAVTKTGVDSLRARVTMHINAVPFITYRPFYQLSSPIGSTESIQRVMNTSEMKHAGDEDLDDAKWGADLARTCTTIIAGATKAFNLGKQIVSTGLRVASVLAPLFGTEAHERAFIRARMELRDDYGRDVNLKEILADHELVAIIKSWTPRLFNARLVEAGRASELPKDIVYHLKRIEQVRSGKEAKSPRH